MLADDKTGNIAVNLEIKKWLMLHTGLYKAILGKGPWPKLGEINNIEHNKGSKIYHFRLRLYYAKHTT